MILISPLTLVNRILDSSYSNFLSNDFHKPGEPLLLLYTDSKLVFIRGSLCSLKKEMFCSLELKLHFFLKYLGKIHTIM